MSLINRPGAFRYLLLAAILRAISKGFEAMGDRAVLEAGVGNGAGAPWFLLALLLLVAAFAAFMFSIRRIYLRVTGRLSQPQPAADIPADIAALTNVFDEHEEFDPDAALSRYMARTHQSGAPQPQQPPQQAQPPRGGFGRKGL